MHSDMKTKHLNSFLFCFQLETGGLFFGWLGIVSSVVVILCSILMIVGLFENVITDESLQQMGYIDSKEANEDAANRVKAFMFATCMILVLVSIVYLVFCVLLIRGTKTVRRFKAKSDEESERVYLISRQIPVYSSQLSYSSASTSFSQSSAS
jgi:hypothetical protein